MVKIKKKHSQTEFLHFWKLLGITKNEKSRIEIALTFENHGRQQSEIKREYEKQTNIMK